MNIYSNSKKINSAGSHYLCELKIAKQPSKETVNPLPTTDERDRLLRLLKLGLIELKFYDLTNKTLVDEIEFIKPFMLQVRYMKAPNDINKEYFPSYSAAKLFNPLIFGNNSATCMDEARVFATRAGLQSQFNYFEKQFIEYAQDKKAYGSDFYKTLDSRYKAEHKEKYLLNPRILSTCKAFITIKSFVNEIHYAFKASDKFETTTINANELKKVLLYSHFSDDDDFEVNDKNTHVLPEPVKPVPYSKFLCAISKEHRDIDEAVLETYNYDLTAYQNQQQEFKYKIYPGIAHDYSLIANLALDTIPASMWIEFFKFNPNLPLMAVPESTRATFTRQELKSLAAIKDTLCIEWNLPEFLDELIEENKSFLYSIDMDAMYLLLTQEQQCNPRYYMALSETSLIHPSIKNIDNADFIDEHDSEKEINLIYPRLSDGLKTFIFRNGYRIHNQIQHIPNSAIETDDDFERLVKLTLTANHNQWEILNLDLANIHPVITARQEQFIEFIINDYDGDDGLTFYCSNLSEKFKGLLNLAGYSLIDSKTLYDFPIYEYKRKLSCERIDRKETIHIQHERTYTQKHTGGLMDEFGCDFDLSNLIFKDGADVEQVIADTKAQIEKENFPLIDSEIDELLSQHVKAKISKTQRALFHEIPMQVIYSRIILDGNAKMKFYKDMIYIPHELVRNFNRAKLFDKLESKVAEKDITAKVKRNKI